MKIGETVRNSLESPWKPSLHNPLGFLENIRPLSRRSFWISFAFSVYALIVVIYVQFFLLGYDFFQIGMDLTQDHLKEFTLLFLFMVAGNFIVDYLSFTQTLVLLRLINRQQSKGSIFIIFFTDLLASINIFTFVYALFLTIAILLIANEQRVAEYVVSIEQEDVSDATLSALAAYPRLSGQFRTQYKVGIYGRNVGERPSIVRALFVSEADLTKAELRDGLRHALEASFPDGAISLRQEDGQAPIEETGAWAPVDFTMVGSIRYWLNASSNFVWWYSNAYLATDDVQDNFFVVATLSPGFQPLDALRARGNQSVMDVNSRGYVAEWCSDSALESEGCSKKVIVLSNDLDALQQELALSLKYGGSLPLYTFFFTSLALTVTIYLFYISLLFLRFCAFFGRRISLPISRLANLDEHPITVISFPIALISSVVFYLAGL